MAKKQIAKSKRDIAVLKSKKYIALLRSESLKTWKQYGTSSNIRFVLGGVFLVFFVFISFLVFGPKYSSSHAAVNNPLSVSQAISPEPIVIAESRHPLTGALLSEPMTVLPQVFGIMVENSADAWPLSGIDEAFLVIEAPVEGSIPRFIAFFSDEQNVKKIGPVRSARPYYVDWNDELQGIYGHVGGSPEALDDIKKDGTFDLNQFFQGEYYYRDEVTRYAPHNVYTTTENLVKAKKEINTFYDRNDVPSSYESWKFVDGVSQSTESKVIHLAWGNGYDVDWKYDPTTNRYMRKQGGVTYVDDNVVVIETDVGLVAGDEKGRRTLRTIGEGKMMMFHNGVVENVTGTWKKETRTSRLRFYDDEGKEIAMNAGKTWVEVTDDLGKVSVK